jgi:conjugative relaxase-like TrwC/TraI family protein
MLNCSPISGGMSPDYYAKDGYYTRTGTEHDRWEGTLSKAMGLEGQVTKEQFEALHDKLVEHGRDKCIALDCAFSAPKSVSLAMAESPQTREEIQKLHQESVSRAVKHIEENYIKTRITKDGHTHEVKTGNCCAAEFEHYTNRNNDLDLHTHVVIENMTVHNGKVYSVDFRGLMNEQKEVGLMYRQYLAQALQREGYELEITDKRHGFFELKGFDREVIMEHSTRRQEILAELEISGGTTAKDAQAAALKTRHNKTSIDLENEYKEINKELFQSGKVKIERNEKYEHRTDQGNYNERSRGQDTYSLAVESSIGSISGGEGQGIRTLAERCGLQDLSSRGLDETAKAPNMLLPGSAISRLAVLQCDRERDAFLLRADAGERRQRINGITAEAVKEISQEKFAFTVPEIRQRIMSAGVLEGITRQEAERSMERAGLVKLGRIEHGEEKSKDVYLTTEENIKREAAIVDRMEQGKGQIKSLDQVQSEVAIQKLSNKKNDQGKSFTPNAEQTNAIHHVLTSEDRYLCIQGLAGTGKTYTMTSIRELCEQEGITVRGACFTGKAADGLQNESGIKSGTIHSFLNQLEAGKFNEKNPWKEAAKELALEALPGGWKDDLKEKPEPVKREGLESVKQSVKELAAEALPGEWKKAAEAELRKADNEARYEQRKGQMKQDGIKQEWDFSKVEKAKGREIWIVDEAGLVDSKLMEQVQKAAEARGAQVVLSGDYQQLPPVGAGEPMKAMIEAGAGTAYLEDIRRQKDIQLLEAVRESVKGDHLKTFKKLDKSGDYREIEGKKERHEAVKGEMTTDKLQDYKKNLLLVSTNADRKAYNKEIRAEYVKRGEMEQGREYKITSRDGDKETIEKRNFAAGDRVIFTANDNKLDVKNGTLGTIEKIEENRFTVRTDAGQQKQFYMDKYNDIDHSYAVTNYKAQGMTVEKVVADMNTKSKAQDRNALYVNVSRAGISKEKAAKGEFEKAVVYTDDKKKLEKQTKEFAHKITSKDFAERIQKMERGNRIENNDRYQAPEKLTLEKRMEQLGKEPQRLTQYKAQEQQRAKELAQEQARKLEQQKAPERQKTIQRDTGMSFSR